ncbi:hypothetical protein ABLE94_02930 [Gordonia sp. VNK1]|uniref:hypothetical protein n=1 Tax=Gordonia oleivorans TaxID=3156618 RepID=UPI0032B51A29
MTINYSLWRISFGDHEIVEDREPVEALAAVFAEQGIEHYVHRRFDHTGPWMLVGHG